MQTKGLFVQGQDDKLIWDKLPWVDKLPGPLLWNSAAQFKREHVV